MSVTSKINNKIVLLERKKKILFLIILDLIVLNFSVYLSWYLRLDINFIRIFEFYTTKILFLLTLLNIFVLYSFSFYDGVSRYLNLEILQKIIPANLLILFVIITLTILFPKFLVLPKSVALIYFITSTLLLCIVRLFLIQIYNFFFLGNFKNGRKKNILFVEAINKDKLKDILNAFDININSIIFIDNVTNDLPKNGEIFGKKFESINNFSKIYNFKNTNFILNKDLIRELNTNNLIKSIKLDSNEIFIAEDNQALKKITLTPFSYDKYLKRKKITTDFFSLKKVLNKKNILVTGAGGSIGSELCNIISLYKNNKLIGLDSTELNLFKIKNRIKKNSKINFIPILGNILDENLLDGLIKKHKIDIVVHAAAYKHVNLVEENIVESLKNNILGTKNCLKVSVKNKIKNFIMVSSDKAENPLSTMGISKRICENLISLELKKNKTIKTSLSSVRFGNVWNSSGSVVEIFKNQLKNNEDLTVTSKLATRYFMLISEAAELILQSILYPKNNAVFILDIGTPVNIYNLARQMLKEHKDTKKTNSKIRFIGLSKKEKTHEILYPKNLSLLVTPNKKIKYFINQINFNNFEKKIFKFFKLLNKKKVEEKNLHLIMKDLIN